MGNMAEPEKTEVTILLVDDDPGHLRLIEKNLRRGSLTNPIVQVGDGQAALDYVNSRADEQSLLMLLDLNMPVLNGYQVLERLRANNRTKRIPVIVLTTTNDPREVDRCYDLGCNVYVTKPVDYEQFSVAIQKLGLLLSVVSIPDRS